MISIHVYVLFGLMLLLSIFEYWFGRMEYIKEENKILEEVRKLCNELLKIKDKGTIVITSLNLSKKKGHSRVIVTTLPKGGIEKNGIRKNKEKD